MDALVWIALFLAGLAGDPEAFYAPPGAPPAPEAAEARPAPVEVPAVWTPVEIEWEPPVRAVTLAPRLSCEMEPGGLACVTEGGPVVELGEPCRMEQWPESPPGARQSSEAGRHTLWKLMNYGRDRADRVFLPRPDPRRCCTVAPPAAWERAQALAPASANPFFVVLFRPPEPEEPDLALLMKESFSRSHVRERPGATGKHSVLLQRDHRLIGKTYARAE